MENTSPHIFTKIYEIMDHFESLCDDKVPTEKKYKDDDDFFSFIFQNVKEVDPEKHSQEDAPPTTPTKEEESISNEQVETNSESNAAPTTVSEESEETIVNAYIKKCYKKIVLKCHPDKNKTSHGSSKIFVRCQEYYNNKLLIGLLYIFYLYSITPPEPLNTIDPNTLCSKTQTIINRMAKEIYIIQKKIAALRK